MNPRHNSLGQTIAIADIEYSDQMASAARKVQERIFGRTATPTPLSEEKQQFPSQERVDPPTPLTINIPKPHATPTPPPRKNNGDSSPKEDQEQPDAATPPLQPFKERLAQKLGNDYKGAEKYRLEQDNKREKHWKRWGPYVSDRQWVSSF